LRSGAESVIRKKIETVSYFRNYKKVKVSDQEFERRLRNKDLSKGGAQNVRIVKKERPRLPV